MTVWFLDYQGTLDRTMSWGTYLGLLVEQGDKIIINTGDAYFASRRVAEVVYPFDEAAKPEDVAVWSKVSPKQGVQEILERYPEVTHIVLSDDMWDPGFHGFSTITSEDVVATVQDALAGTNVTFEVVPARELGRVFRQVTREQRGGGGPPQGE